MDKVLPHLHRGLRLDQAEGIKTRWRKTILLVTAITLHNIPEGLAVGVAFGAVAANLPSADSGRRRRPGAGHRTAEFPRRHGRVNPSAP